MNNQFDHELSGPLAALVRSVDEAPSTATSTAQERLIALMQSKAKPARSNSRRWLAFAATAAIALVITVIGPMLSGGGVAFAAVQNHFSHFDNLVMNITQSFKGQPIQSSEIIVNAQGITRTNVGKQLSIIVDPKQGRMLTLLHDSREAMLTSIPKSQPQAQSELKWLQELRNFKGEATPLPNKRIINGHSAQGWVLNLQGLKMEIWADADGLPLQMRQEGSTELLIDYSFEFDREDMDKQLNSVPPSDYKLVQPEKD
jgi:hypothetical protein